jgi:tetratricopeptide (TPR) repeat protein
MQTLSPTMSIRTTNGTIALLNLNAQVDGLELEAGRGRLASRSRADLVDLLILRGQIVGQIADYERAVALAEQGVSDAPADGQAVLTRARARACLHRFDEALIDLEAAEHFGLADAELQGERAAILLAVGRYEEALALLQAGVARRADFESLWARAAFHAECGEVAIAERLYDDSRERFRGVSPFALAQQEFQRGHMWQEHGDNLTRAHEWLMAAWQRLPAYARAEGHLAEVESAMGEHEGAIARLRRLATTSDDPDYAAQLARILGETRQLEDADVWRARAEERYDELVARHPAAFADHGAEFWSSVGGDPQRAVGLAKLNLEVRRTPRAQALLSRAIEACSTGPTS